MGVVTIHPATTKNPLSLIGEMAGICWGSNTQSREGNIKRALECIDSGHGRVSEFPDVYLTLDGWSARVLRELYTHIGGMPTRLQASTRYIDYKNFSYVIPPSIETRPEALKVYNDVMRSISNGLVKLNEIGVPREDSALLLPLGMDSKMVYKVNLRTLIDMSHQRLCTRAYHEFRLLMLKLMQELSAYSEEWEMIVQKYFTAKCVYLHGCPESKSCGYYEKLEAALNEKGNRADSD